jgi:TolB-like protein/DNA-binding winged helix-turn-helix (wHTH) protein/predicted TPR repeat methyltransferase
MDPSPTPTRLQFGPFVADFSACELLKDGKRIRLQDKPMRLLAALTVNPGEVVSREHLQKQLWPDDTFVDFETGLNAAVRKLREALADSPDNPQYVETIPKHGYRFLAEVRGNGPNGSSVASEKPSPVLTSTSLGRRTIASLVETVTEYRRAKRLWMVITAALALGSLALVLEQPNVLKVLGLQEQVFGTNGVPPIHSLAVLPLQNLSPDPSQEYFSDGMTDALITDLAQIGSLKVISRTSSMQYKQTKKSLPTIARELNADGIVEGTVQRAGDRVRITAQLIHGPSDKHLWANSYERDVRDVLTLEREVAGDIARRVQARIDTEKHVHQLRPINPEALEAYLQGNSHLHRFSRGFGDVELKLASDYFRQAIDTEPDFAPAYVGLSKARRGTLRSSSEDVAIATKAADRAVELDPNLSEAWTAVADIRCDFWDWAGAEQDYRRSLSLNPNDAIAHEGLGQLLDALGRLDEGWKEAEVAQQLDPNEEHLEAALDNRHEYERIIQHITTMLDADPDNGVLHHQLYEGYVGKGMYKEAVQHLEQALVLFGFQESAAKVRQAFAASGYKGAMRKYAEELEHLQATNQIFIPINVADAYAAAGDKDRAFYWLEKAYKRRGHGNAGVSMVFLNRDPGLEPLRSDPRYKDLLRRVGLPP